MQGEKILHLMSPIQRQNINFIKIYCEKRRISIFLENIYNFENN